MKKLLVTTTALAFMSLGLSACNDETSVDEVLSVDKNLNLATFMSWPNLEATVADPEAMGQNNLIFVTDRSGSMNEYACGSDTHSKSNVVADVVSQFIPTIPSDFAVGYVDFGDDTEVRVPLGKNNRKALVAAAGGHAPDMGGTMVGHAIEKAYDMLAEQALKQGSVGTFRMVLIVDGGANDLRKLNEMLDKMAHTPIEVLTAGFCIGSGHTLNQPNDMTYVEANDVSGLTKVLSAAVQMEAPASIGSFVGADPEPTEQPEG